MAWYCIIQHYIILYYIILYYIILDCIILYVMLCYLMSCYILQFDQGRGRRGLRRRRSGFHKGVFSKIWFSNNNTIT